MRKETIIGLAVLTIASTGAIAQRDGLVDMSKSRSAVMCNTGVGAVRWTGGFWGERFDVLSNTSLKSMWETWQSKEGKGWNNFLVAAGEKEGVHHGPPFHDGDMYKWLEAVAAVYAVNHDEKLKEIMDEFVRVVVKAQRADGYIHTPVIIDELNRGVDTHAEVDNTVIGTAVGKEDEKGAFANRLNFETYNLGHLMTAGIVHRRATGSDELFNAAVKACDFLCHFYETASAELARNAICPSHYMGVVEMWRETGNPRYLELAKNLIEIRGMVENGTDDNQDRIPFRKQYTAMGHAVRANYLYAGVADVIAETGDEGLKANLDAIWTDIVTRKMYVTGACGALYDGTSPDGTNYTPDSIQKVHQSYGRAYQLPNTTAHNETCANIGNMLLNWRMLQITGEAKYADILETALYNSVLPGISLDGERYFYTNPLRISEAFPYKLRWPKERTKYISCFCCPPNTLRTLCEVQNYAYALSPSEGTLWCTLYGQSELSTTLGGKQLIVTQKTAYPYDGQVEIKIEEVGKKALKTIKLRIPEWCEKAEIYVNGTKMDIETSPNTFVTLDRNWAEGDQVTLEMEMRARLLEANPLAEEIRNQVCVKRGPLVYCLEAKDIEGGHKIDDITIPTDIELKTVETEIDGAHIMALEGTAQLTEEGSWAGVLYREVGRKTQKVGIRLIPHFAWGNRGKMDMTIWMPIQRK